MHQYYFNSGLLRLSLNASICIDSLTQVSFLVCTYVICSLVCFAADCLFWSRTHASAFHSQPLNPFGEILSVTLFFSYTIPIWICKMSTSRVEEMVHWVRCLFCKHGDLSLNLQDPFKKLGMDTDACNVSIGGLKQADPLPKWQASLQSETLSQWCIE